ncbi:MAG: YfhO family protein [Verrucomicrobiota bacterium]
MTAFSRYMEGSSLDFGTLGITLFALLGFLYLPVNQIQGVIDPALRQAAAIFLGGYAVLLVIGQIMKQQNIVGWTILALATIELVYFDGITVSNHPTVTKQQLRERVGYNDKTVDVIRELQANDRPFYRIRKVWPSTPSVLISYNDAMVFGYYGTSSYSSFNSLNYIKFLMAVDAISKDHDVSETIWCRGLIAHPLLSTFACEKYVLTKQPEPFKAADYYEFVRSYGNIYLFRNQLFLPFGLAFHQYISEDTFLQLPSDWAKPLALMHSVVLSDKNVANGRGLSHLSGEELKRRMIETALPDIVASRRATAFTIRSFSQTRITGTARTDGKSILVLQMPFDPGWHAHVDGRVASTFRVDVGLLGIALEGGEHDVRLHYRPPLLYAGATLSLLSLCVLFWSLSKYPRIRLPGEICADT